MTEEITELAKKIRHNMDIDTTNDMLRDANWLNELLGKPERYSMIPYPKT